MDNPFSEADINIVHKLLAEAGFSFASDKSTRWIRNYTYHTKQEADSPHGPVTISTIVSLSWNVWINYINISLFQYNTLKEDDSNISTHRWNGLYELDSVSDADGIIADIRSKYLAI